MKRALFILLAIIMIAGIMPVTNTDAASKAKYRFQYPSWESPGSWHNENFYLWWPRRVEELSKGEVKFDIHPGQVLMKGSNHYEAVRDNTVTFAPSATPYESDVMPLPTIDELPFIFSDWDTYFKMHDEMLAEGLQEYYNSKGVYYIAGMLVEPYGVWTTKKWGPIRKLEDLKGCKIRTPGGWLNNALTAMGAVPVPIPVVDMYMSLQTGVIDGVSLAEASQISHRSQEVVKYASRVNYACPGIHIIANLKTWNALPLNIREIMQQAGKDLLKHYSEAQTKYWTQTTPDELKKSNVELIEISPQEKKRMVAATASVKKEWLSKYAQEFDGLGQKLYDIMEKYQK